MTQEKEIPFASVLTALFSADDPPIHLLYRLSDMGETDFNRFKREWPAVDEDRRIALTRHMADIAEDNYLVDFTPVFAHLFTDISPLVRVAALDGVWDAETPDIIGPILKMLDSDADVAVRAAAARALAHYILLAEWGQIDGHYAVPIVDALLAEYEKPRAALEVKRAALEAVSPAAHPRIAELITEAYDDGSDDLQLSAIFAMGNSADERWLPILDEELKSPSADFRAEAARACGMIGDPNSIDALESLLNDDDLEVGIAAVYALGQIGGDRVFELLSSMAEDPNYEDYFDAIDEALEEMDWAGGGFDLLGLPEDDDDEDFPDVLRLN